MPLYKQVISTTSSKLDCLRSALYKAVANAGSTGISHDQLPEHVFQSLDLRLICMPKTFDPIQALKDTQSALRTMLGYRLYRDLKRGWRTHSPES